MCVPGARHPPCSPGSVREAALEVVACTREWGRGWRNQVPAGSARAGRVRSGERGMRVPALCLPPARWAHSEKMA